MTDTLWDLFTLCRAVPYSQAGRSANFALRRQGERLYIFFEDSDGRKDWRRNLEFSAVPYGEFYAHRGFVSVWEELRPIVAQPASDPHIHSVTVAGYSHGAALAVLCHEFLWRVRPDLRGSFFGCGFGCPRVFRGKKPASAQEIWQNFTVVRNLDDLVTHLPPKAWGYYHVGKLTEIGARGRYSPIDAHRAENYLAELKKHAPPG